MNDQPLDELAPDLAAAFARARRQVREWTPAPYPGPGHTIPALLGSGLAPDYREVPPLTPPPVSIPVPQMPPDAIYGDDPLLVSDRAWFRTTDRK